MAVKEKNCVAIAADRRFGIQAQMVTTDFQKIFPIGDRLYVGLAGLATDVQTVAQRLKFLLNLYELKEGRQIKPYTLMSMVANLLYEKQFHPYYTEPVIAGLDLKTFKPFICSLDLIGCPMVTDDFVVSAHSDLFFREHGGHKPSGAPKTLDSFQVCIGRHQVLLVSLPYLSVICFCHLLPRGPVILQQERLHPHHLHFPA